MRNKNTISMHTVTLILTAGLVLVGCSDSSQKQTTPPLPPAEKLAVEQNPKPAQTSMPENPQPFWKEIDHTAADEEIFQNLGKATHFFINTNSIELNPGNPNWRNTVVAVNLTPKADKENLLRPSSLLVRYTVDCASNLVLPLDLYLFEHKKAQGKLLLEQALSIGPLKVDEQEISFYSEMKKEVCHLSASNPLDVLATPQPDWQLVHEPQPPQANPFFAYIDKKSIHPSIEQGHWKRATMLTQINALANKAPVNTQSTEPASQLWQISIDCTRLQFRFDFVAAMEQPQGRGSILQVGLSDKGFETPKEKPEKKLVETICNTTL